LSHRVEAGTNQEFAFSQTVGQVPYRVFARLLNENSVFAPAYQVSVYSMEEARAEIGALRLQILASATGALGLGLLVTLFLAHNLAAPLLALVRGTNEIKSGNYQVRVSVRSRDEVGQLAGSFNEMAHGLALKERYRTVLNMVADERVAQRLIDGQLALGGELREISVLFCDIRGFTALTQDMPPAEVIEMLNEHMTALTGIVKKHGGVLDKFVGDLLMAIFGAPIELGQDTAQAARCALALIRERARLNESSRHRIEIGIGLATGKVVAGCMGSADRLNYTVLGDRVNLASRLCDKARVGEVLVDDNTLAKLGGLAVAESVGELTLKGFSATVPAFQLREVKS
jgi:class 3 adenylate cyclase